MNNIDILKELLSPKGITVEETFKVTINGGKRRQYAFRKDNHNIAPVLSEDELNRFNPEKLEELVENVILPAWEDKVVGQFNEESSEALINLIRTGDVMPCAMNTLFNEEIVPYFIHRDVMDLTLYYRLVVSADKDGLHSIIIDENVLEMAGITEEELFQRAKSYVLEHISVSVLENNDSGTAHERNVPDEQQDDEMLLVKYDQDNNGAGILAMAALDSDILKSMCADYPICILPCDLHEIVLVKDKNASEELDYYAHMAVNRNIYTNKVKDMLSNSVYVLNPSGKVEVAKQGKTLEYAINRKEALNSLFSDMFDYAKNKETSE